MARGYGLVRKPSIFKKLETVVGKGYVISHPDDLLVFEYDGSIDKAVPQAVVFPVSMEEVRRVVAVAQEFDVAVVGRGSGTGLSGGAIASAGGLQVALTRMNRILEMDVENRLAVVEPGVINLQLDEAARKHGLRYAPDPSSQRACSIGGNVAENAGGPHCLAYGVTSNHVLGLEVALEDGSVTWLGGRTRETVGYDLRGVFVGSEGTFGIATKAVVRLLAAPPSIKTYMAVFRDIESACEAVSSVIGKGMVPAAMEMIDALTIKAVQNLHDMGLPKDAGCVLLVEVEGLREEVEEMGGEVEGVLRKSGSREVRWAESAAERERLWRARKGALGALGSLAPNYYLVDGVAPRTKLASVLRQVSEISERYKTPIANVFHAGDGNLHPCILFDEREAGSVERVIEVGGEILKVCVEAGGSLSGEHGIGLEKKAYMPLVFSEEDMSVMRLVREGFSPSGRFNPGKIFPGGPMDGDDIDVRAMQKRAVSVAGPGAHV
ncbi:MAG: FAD-binding protein [SAR202 cluster bacterium]|nr:FAD-binding protein [SAR202 cluster bacterium]